MTIDIIVIKGPMLHQMQCATFFQSVSASESSNGSQHELLKSTMFFQKYQKVHSKVHTFIFWYSLVSLFLSFASCSHMEWFLYVYGLASRRTSGLYFFLKCLYNPYFSSNCEIQKSASINIIVTIVFFLICWTPYQYSLGPKV